MWVACRRSLASKPEVLDALGYPAAHTARSSADGSSCATEDGIPPCQEDLRGGFTHPPLERIPELRLQLGNGTPIPAATFSARDGHVNRDDAVVLPRDLSLDLRPFMNQAPLAIRSAVAFRNWETGLEGLDGNLAALAIRRAMTSSVPSSCWTGKQLMCHKMAGPPCLAPACMVLLGAD